MDKLNTNFNVFGIMGHWKKTIILVVIVSFSSLTISSISAQGQYEIPSWVKGIAEFWVEGKITDSDFGEGIAFLIDQEIIKVPIISELKNKVSQLENENADLRAQINSQRDIPTPSPQPPITIPSIIVFTDKSSYDGGETIIIWGEVSELFKPRGTLFISTGGNRLPPIDFDVDDFGSFKTSVTTGGPLWDVTGIYTIEAVIGIGGRDVIVAENTFYYDSTSMSSSSSSSSSLEPDCDPSYPDICIPSYPPDLDCGEISYTNFRVIGSDPHGFDRDNDGIGCES